MKLTLILSILTVFQLFATETYSQLTKLTLKLEDVKVSDALREIENQSEFFFLYSPKLIDVERKVNIDTENETIADILSDIFGGDVKFAAYDRQIILTPNELSGVLSVFQQQKQITGTVTDDKGNPLPGVTVQVKGTTLGMLTDASGKFTLDNLPDGSTIVFSFIGMQTQEIEVGNKNLLNVTLQEVSIGLDEVVVIGYGKQKKRDVSSAISSVSMEALKDKPVANFTSAITGQMAGVRILSNNNAPGGGTNIIIRGINSINATNNPLIVIDGFPLKDGFNQSENPLNSINTNDIESVEVLKDASSSAIYGAQAANGVIIITTKKGKTGKPTININVSTGLEQMINKMHPLNREDFLKFLDDSRANAYVVDQPNYGSDDPDAPQWSWTDDNETRINNWRLYSSDAAWIQGAAAAGDFRINRWITVSDETKAQTGDSDWQDIATQIGKVQNIQLSTNGGTENLKYMVSGGYYTQDGIVSETGYNRFSFRANVELKINNWIKTGLLLAPTLENTDVMGNMEGMFYSMVSMPPLYTPYDDDGQPKYLGEIQGDWREWNMYGTINPLVNYKIQDNRRTARNLSTIFAEINITKDLVFRSEFHNEFRNWERNYFIPSDYPQWNTRVTRPQGINNITSRLYWNMQNFLTYSHIFGKHNINAMLGYSAEETSYRNTWIRKYDYATNAVPTLNQAITVLDAQNDAANYRSTETMIGSFARAMYNYGGKYYLTASVRRDGSSKFGSDRKWGIFPSFSAAWRISDEPFFAPLKSYINDLKIRGGWGIIGNSGIGSYDALSTLSATSYILGPGSTLSPGYVDSRVSNSRLGWESTTDYSLGTDIEILKSRISLSVDYFYKLTEDMLFSLPLPTITGFSSYMVNIGSMRNRGFEYLLKTVNLAGDFRWTTTFNLSYYKNRVLSTGQVNRPLISNNSYTIEGKPLASLWGSQFLGPYRDWEDVKTNPIVNANVPSWLYRSSPGTPKVADVNGDGIIDGNDNTVIGSPNPDFIWGMANTFEYKGFDLSIMMNGVQGGHRMLTQMEGIMARSTGTSNTVYEYFNNYWRPDRTDAKYAAPTRKSWDYTSNRGTLVFKGTYAKLQNITLGYNMPKGILQRMNLSQIRVYTSVQNAFIITKYPGFNPEVNQSGNSALSQGIDGGAYPLTRIVSFGINLSL